MLVTPQQVRSWTKENSSRFGWKQVSTRSTGAPSDDDLTGYIRAHPGCRFAQMKKDLLPGADSMDPKLYARMWRCMAMKITRLKKSGLIQAEVHNIPEPPCHAEHYWVVDMRTVTMTFSFTEAEWQTLRKCCLRDGKQPTYGEVTNEIKLLALRHAKCLDDVEKQLDAMAAVEESK